MQRIILHLDFDSFFASCEQQFNPVLRGKPIGVTATNGRTCIIAASREAKKLGVKSPTRVWEAQQIVPDLITVPAHFEDYWEISKTFISIAKNYSPFVEVFSLDEVFMDVTGTAHFFGGVDGLIATIRQELKEKVGEYITVSVGISHNKLLAKLASGMRKPNGVYEIGNYLMAYEEAALTDICGIGHRIAARLHLIGVDTLLKLHNIPKARLVKEFGNAEGEFLYRVGQGVDDNPVIPYYDPIEVKSVGRNYCLPRNEYEMHVVLQNMYELCEEVGIKLRRLNKSARTVGAYLSGTQAVGVRKTYARYITTGKDIFENILYQINHNREYTLSFMQEQDYVRQMGVWVSNLVDTPSTTLSLFERDQKWERLAHTIDAVNDKYGDHTLRNGFLLYADKLTTKPNGFMADKYEREQIRGL
jgi:DNA polymerase-4